MRIGLVCLMLVIGAGVGRSQTVGDASLQPRSTMGNCVAPMGEWATPAEKSCYATTPDYDGDDGISAACAGGGAGAGED